MTVFKAYLKILKKNLGMVIFYTMLMVTFAGLSINTSNNTTSFKSEKPDIVVFNNDEEKGITKVFIKYLKDNANVKDMKDDDNLKDAIFHHEISYVVYIPKNFRDNFINNKDVKVDVKLSEDYDATLANMLVKNYLTKALKYRDIYKDENMVIASMSYEKEGSNIKLKSTKNVSKLDKMSYYFSYANYPIIAGIIYVMCLIVVAFNEIKIKRRNVISSTDYKKFSKDLMVSNFVFTTFMFIIYVILAFILNGSIIFSSNGLLHILNMAVFIISIVCMSFVITSLMTNKNAINGIIQVVALGSSFLCGSFVPMEILPNFVLKIAHIFPSYYYVDNNNIIKTIDVIRYNDLKPILINLGILLIFAIIFVIISTFINKMKRVDD